MYSIWRKLWLQMEDGRDNVKGQDVKCEIQQWHNQWKQVVSLEIICVFLCAMTTRMKKVHVASDNGRIRPLTFHYRYSVFFCLLKLQCAACAPHLICSLPNLHVATPEWLFRHWSAIPQHCNYTITDLNENHLQPLSGWTQNERWVIMLGYHPIRQLN